MMLKIAFRNFRRNKIITVLNIIGLAMGISSAILVFLLGYLHATYDNYHPQGKNIFRFVTHYEYANGDREFTPGIPSPLADAVRKDYDIIKDVTIVHWYNEIQVSSWPDSVNYAEKFKEQGAVAFVDPRFFDLFSYKWISGSSAVLNDSLAAVITEGYAKKYFPGMDAMGKVIKLDNKVSFVVKGIIGDIPENTFFRQRIFVPYSARKLYEPQWQSNWGDARSSTQCFALLKDGHTLDELNKLLRPMGAKYLPAEDAKVRFFQTQALSDMHLNTRYDGYLSKAMMIAFSLVGLFLIVTACVNFINMATAQALTRTKEVGVKKAIGAGRRQLITQFLTETAVVTLCAMVIGLVITWFVIPPLNTLFLSVFSISLKPSLALVLFLVVIFVFTVLVSGLYPALVLSGFNPVEALSQKINAKKAGNVTLKRALVIFQFFIAYALIIAALTIDRQMKLTKEASMGFDKSGIMMVPIPVKDSIRQQQLHDKLAALPTVKGISYMHTPPAYRSNITNNLYFEKVVPGKEINFNLKRGDDKYISVFGLELVAGSNFNSADTTVEMLVNETFVKAVPGATPQNIIGKKTVYFGREYTIRGVLKDFNMYSLRNKVMPCAVLNDPKAYRNCGLKVALTDLDNTVKAVEKIWTEEYPGYVYELSFLADHIGKFYVVEEIIQKLINAFCIVAVIISCLGLYGLIAFMAVQKAREIGIRKTLGATVSNVVLIFVKELAKPLFIGYLLAAPVAWFAMNQWLSGYQYRISIGPFIFITALVLPLLIGLITIGYEAYKAAVLSPVKTLKAP